MVAVGAESSRPRGDAVQWPKSGSTAKILWGRNNYHPRIDRLVPRKLTGSRQGEGTKMSGASKGGVVMTSAETGATQT